MIRILMVAAFALLLAGCARTQRDSNAMTGALIGGGTGAVIGGVASRTAGGALAGGVIGAVAGGVIGAAMTPDGRCYYRTRSGRVRWVRC